MKYLGHQPFIVGGSTAEYRDGWNRIFGKSCRECGGTGQTQQNVGGDEEDTAVMVKCSRCEGTGKEPQS